MYHRAKLNVPDIDFLSAATICKIFRNYRFETIRKAGMYEMAYRLDEDAMAYYGLLSKSAYALMLFCAI